MHETRRGTLRAFTDEGRLLWNIDQDDTDLLWFQISLALSRDGETLATFYTDARDVRVRLFDAGTGRQVWERTTSRRSGTSCLSVSPDGQLVVLAHGDVRTSVTAWSREGDVVWEGEIPLTARVARIEAHGLLVASQWVVQLTPGSP
jgi:WD40 repeat protein